MPLIIITAILILVYLMNKDKGLFDFDYAKFQNQLGLSESSNSYTNSSNGIAYGRYQFIPSTIERISKEIGIQTPTIRHFLTDPPLQDAFYIQYVNDILKFISDNQLNFFIGKNVTGKKNYITTKINIYGLVAGAWLGGEGGLSDFLKHNVDRNDGHTYISDYIAKFSQLNNLMV